MSRTQTKKAIAVMQHYADGGKVECSLIRKNKWVLDTVPSWNWSLYDYRIKKMLPEVGKWYEINGFPKCKCIAYEFNQYIFIDEKAVIESYDDSCDFSTLKEVRL